MKRDLTNIGWTVFFLRCADGTLYAGNTRNLDKELIEIRAFKTGIYFSTHPDRFPVEVVFKEVNLIFKEAYAKVSYMRKMNKKMKEKLIRTGQWPIGGTYEKYLESLEI